MDTARAATEQLSVLLRRERTALGEFLVALADFDAKRLWVDLGYSSLFYYLHRELHLSKAAAQYRKVAAELIQRIPAIVAPLRDGRLCLTTVVEVARVVTPENWEAVLPRFYGRTRRDAMDVVAELSPHPAPPTQMVVTAVQAAPRRLSASVAPSMPALAPLGVDGVPPTSGSRDEPTLREIATPASSPRPAMEIVPLDATQRRLHLTVSKRVLEKLEAAKDALAHTHAGASEEAILEAALDLLLARAAKRHGRADRPRKHVEPAADPAHIPAAVKRAVFTRDGGKCRWPLASGGVCGCTRHLQYDHIEPLSRGGRSTVDNVRLLCAFHNLQAARAVLGDRLMDRYARNPRAPAPTPDQLRSTERYGAAGPTPPASSQQPC